MLGLWVFVENRFVVDKFLLNACQQKSHLVNNIDYAHVIILTDLINIV